MSACCPEFLVLICEFFTAFSLFKTNTIKELAEVKDRILTLKKETFQVRACTFVILENSYRFLSLIVSILFNCHKIRLPYPSFCRVFIRHWRSENSSLTTQNSLANVQWPMAIFYSDIEPLSKYSPVTYLHLSPANRILGENPDLIYRYIF